MSGQDKQSGHRVVIGLGSNIEPEKNLQEAFLALQNHAQVLKSSGVWQNPAVGSNGPDYLNAAVLLSTDLDLNTLKSDVLCRIEEKLDRVRKSDQNADRTIDLDILIADGIPLDDELWTRAHVSVPAAQVAPFVRHPDSGEILQEAAQRLLPDQDFYLRTDLTFEQ